MVRSARSGVIALYLSPWRYQQSGAKLASGRQTTVNRRVKRLPDHELAPPMLSLRTLGSLSLHDGDTALLGGRKKPLALLAYLLRHRARPSPRETLAAMLWPDSRGDLAKQSLRQAISELRTALGDELLADATAITVGTGVWVDANALEAHVSASSWSKAITLWNGDFLVGLEDLGDEGWRTWLEGERAALRKQFAFSCSRQVGLHESRAEWGAATRVAERWLAALPEDEHACIALVTAMRAASRSAQAASSYAAFVERLRRDMGQEPSPALARLGAALAQDDRRDRRRPSAPAHALTAPEMVGRQAAFQRLVNAWSAARDSRGVERVVVVSAAEDGLGKTRLCDELIRFVEAQGVAALVIKCRAFAGERDKPFGTLQPALAALVGAPGLLGASPETLASLRQVSAEFRTRFPKLLADPPKPPPAEAFREAVLEVAAERPVLLVIDDVPDADPESLLALAEVIRRPPARMLLVLTGGDPASWTEPASALARDLARRSAHVEWIELRPLTQSESLQLVASMGSVESTDATIVSQRLHAESGGNPGEMERLVRQLADRAAIALNAAGIWALTRPLDDADLAPAAATRAAMLARVGALSASARALAEAIAVADPLADAALVERASALDASAFAAALRELLACLLVREVDGVPSRYTFMSGAGRRVVYDSMAPSRRRLLHRATARALRASRAAASAPIASEAAAAAIAHHERASGVTGWRDRRVQWAVAAVVLIAAGVASYALATRSTPVVAIGSPVLLADVQNLTGDSVLDRSLYEAALVGLQESGQVSIVPRARVKATLQLMRRSTDGGPLDASVAREVAQREGVSRVILFSVARFDTDYLLSARILDPGSGRDLYDSEARASTRAHLLTALDRLVVRIRRALGEARSRTNDAPAGLPRVTTRSLEALLAYANGRRAFAERDFAAAQDAFSRAVAIDSEFALAHAALADVYFVGVGDRIAGDSSLNRALHYRGRLGEREQLALRISVARYRGPASEEARLSEEMARRYPSRDTWYSLGTVLMRQRQCPRAIPALRQALSFDSTLANAHINIATCEQFLGDYAAATREYAHAQRLDSTTLVHGSVNVEWGNALLRSRGAAAADSAFRLMLRRPTALDRAFGFRSLAYLSMYRGRYRDAIAFLDSAITLTHEVGATDSEFRNDVIRAEAEITAGDTTAARQTLDRADGLARRTQLNAVYMLYEAHAATRAGDHALARDAERRAISSSRPTLDQDRSRLALLAAVRLVDDGDYAQALSRLDEARDTLFLAWIETTRARALEGLGHPDSALAVVRRVAERSYFGWEMQDEWERAELRVAQLWERVGRRTAAVQAYRAYANRWDEGDADLPELVDARRALTRLAGADTASTIGNAAVSERPRQP